MNRKEPGFFRYLTRYNLSGYKFNSERMSQENGDHEEREVEFEHLLSREEVVEYLQAFTEGLEGGRNYHTLGRRRER